MMSADRSIDGPIARSITSKIQESFADLQHFSINNDSYKHSGHAGMADAGNRIESHFKLNIVSDKFQGMSLPMRHRMIYNLLDEELKNGVHALQLVTRTPAEQLKRTQK